MRDDAVGHLLKAPVGVPQCEDVAAWWPLHLRNASLWRNPMDLAIAGGFGADRVGWAFVSGYQAALHALFAGAPEDRICALCVTEVEGNSPKAIRTELRRDGNGWRLDGAKRWTTLGPDGAVFFVAARDAVASGERAVIRVARVTSGAAGMTVTLMPPTRFVPEVPHAQLRFEGVRVADDALLPGDGYTDYVKKFRTIEDLHVNAAILAYLVREARRLAWPPEWIEATLALVSALRSIAAGDAAAPATHLALAGALTQSGALLARAAAGSFPAAQ
jgi:acyl-CoA dehydrogenase